jgi:hypothetical protein
MRDALVLAMRPIPVLASALGLALCLTASPAAAGERGGSSGGGGGRLGSVSTGLGNATSSGSPSTGGGGNVPATTTSDDADYDGRYDPFVLVPMLGGYAFVERRVAPVEPRRPGDHGATVDFFIGGQKVFESDGAVTANIAFVDRWFRVAGSVSRYWEDATSVTLTMPTLSAGIKVVDAGLTHVWFEGGFAYVKTNDPVMDTAITGGFGGMHLEHWFTPKTRLIGDVRLMSFQHDVSAASARVGLRFGNLEAAFRVLDFSVGPALYGPEVGLAF